MGTRTDLDQLELANGCVPCCYVAMLMGGSPVMAYLGEVHNALELYREKQEKLAG